jgi:gluconate kinase
MRSKRVAAPGFRDGYKMNVEQLAGWTPIRVYWQESSPMVDWCYSGEQRFIEPFFYQTIDRCLRNPFNMLFRHQTPIEMLGEWTEAHPGVPPTGFIFHLSRCGSTLMAQMLSALPQNIVISEAAPIDSILRARVDNQKVADDTRAEWLKWMINSLGQRRSGEEKNLFIKFDSWSILDLNIVRRAFPTVPWIFLYRDPVEIMVSQMRKRGAHVIPGGLEPELLGMDYSSILQMEPPEFCARVLAVVCDAALQHHASASARLINYCQLPDVVWSSLLDFFKVEYTAAEIDRMRDASQFYAKNPSLQFMADGELKDREASQQVREMSDRWIKPLYERLEAIRLSL